MLSPMASDERTQLSSRENRCRILHPISSYKMEVGEKQGNPCLLPPLVFINRSEGVKCGSDWCQLLTIAFNSWPRVSLNNRPNGTHGPAFTLRGQSPRCGPPQRRRHPRSLHRSQEEAVQPRPPSLRLLVESTRFQPSPAVPPPHPLPRHPVCSLTLPLTLMQGDIFPPEPQVLATPHGSNHVPTTAGLVQLVPEVHVSGKVACSLCFPADCICAFEPAFFPMFASFFWRKSISLYSSKESFFKIVWHSSPQASQAFKLTWIPFPACPLWGKS